MIKSTYPFSLPPIPYPYDSMEPYIDTETMHYHYDKHYKGYIDKLNEALKPFPGLHSMTLTQILESPEKLPGEMSDVILRNAGGVYNHYLFFKGLAPAESGGHQPEGQLLALIDSSFGSVEAFKSAFSAQAMSVFGSGWSCLALGADNNLHIFTLANQDTAVPLGMAPVMLFDVWEHAYYLKYKNMRADYISQLWNVIVFPELVPLHAK